MYEPIKGCDRKHIPQKATETRYIEGENSYNLCLDKHFIYMLRINKTTRNQMKFESHQ